MTIVLSLRTAIVLAVAAAAVLFGAPAQAHLDNGGIRTEGNTITASGVNLETVADCDDASAGEVVKMYGKVRQVTTGARSGGTSDPAICTGAFQDVPVDTNYLGSSPAFEPGSATACISARTRPSGGAWDDQLGPECFEIQIESAP